MGTDLNSLGNADHPSWTFPEALQQLLEAGEEEFLIELIEVFKSQTQVRVHLIKKAIEQGRLDEARAQAHAIKGGSSQVGADRLAAACLALETRPALTAAEAAALAAEVERLFAEACRLMALASLGGR
jgi:HPt (histidine-containing phosphotransfer) domain-containing protein